MNGEDQHFLKKFFFWCSWKEKSMRDIFGSIMRDQWETRGVLGDTKGSVRPLLRGLLWWKSWDVLGSVLLFWGWVGRKEVQAAESHVLGQVSETKTEEPWEHPSVCGR